MTTTTFDPVLPYHRTALLLSREIYSPTSGYFRQIASRDGTVVGAYLDPSSHTLFITFRGSDDKNDWRKNLDTQAVSGVHRGFYEAAGDVAVVVRNMIADYGRRSQVVFCGHSLGGAIATVYAHKMHRLGQTTPMCVTFGSPRPFRDSSAQAPFSLVREARYTTDGDPVPHLPFKFFGWRHRTSARVLTRRGLKPRQTLLGWIAAMARSFSRGGRAHSITTYIRLFDTSLP